MFPIYLDNATNFVGANQQLKEVHELFLSQRLQDEMLRILSPEDI